MKKVKFYKENNVPWEFHKAKIVQQVTLLPIRERYQKITEAGNNLFLMQNEDIYLDMLTDSGVNAMSDKMQSAMFIADDSYAGSVTYMRMAKKILELFGMRYFLPAHQGRACEHILVSHFVHAGDIVPMNYKFDSIKEHLKRANAHLEEFLSDDGLIAKSDNPFKGNFDIIKLENFIKRNGTENIPFIRIEAGTNLIGGQPISFNNIREVSMICKQFDILLILDGSLLQDNLYFIKQREEECKNMSIRQIAKAIVNMVDIMYFSARKLGFGRGGGICIRNEKHYLELRDYVTTYEGFTTYGGMSVREMEAITVGLEETMNEDIISQGPLFIEFMSRKLTDYGIPVVLPAGGLGVHINAGEFLKHIPRSEYPAGALSVAIYLISGIRTMERGTLSENRLPDGSENYSDMELVRVAIPRRVFTLSQIIFAIDRIKWLFDNKSMIKGLKFYDEPKNQRFYFGLLAPVDDWQVKLIEKFEVDFGDSL